MKPTFFATPAELRAWFEAHHQSAKELLVGFYKRGSGKPSITWPESVDEALCFGWIDGVRKSIDEDAYTIRFTPRKPNSIWSAINVAKVAALETLGRMTPAGRRAFEKRTPERTAVYSFERKAAAVLSPDEEKTLRANAKAAEFFDAQPPWYRRTSIHWVVSAKRDETRRRRLEQLIADSAQGRTIGLLTRAPSKALARAPKALEAASTDSRSRGAARASQSRREASARTGSSRTRGAGAKPPTPAPKAKAKAGQPGGNARAAKARARPKH